MTPTPQESAATQPADKLVERLRGVVAVVVALLLLVGFAVLVFFLTGKASSATDQAWTRFVYIFGAAEALVFTAVGWLFGREINRQAVDGATSRADSATARAESAVSLAADQTARGQALKAAVKARRGAAAADPAVEERAGLEGETAPAPVAPVALDELARLADTLFPEP